MDNENLNIEENNTNEVVDGVSEDLYAPIGDVKIEKPANADQENLQDELKNSEDLFQGEKSNDTTLVDNDVSTQSTSEQQREFEKLMGGIDAAEKYIKPSKSFDEQNSFDIKLLTTYMGKKYPKFIKKKFSFPGLILGYIYLIYRKFYGIGVFYGLVFSFIIGFTYTNPIISLVALGLCLFINLFIAVVFNKKYIDKSYARAKAFEVNNNGLADEVIIDKVAKMGKLSIASTIVIVVLITAIGAAGGYFLNQFLNIDLSFNI